MQYEKLLDGLRKHIKPDSALVEKRAKELWADAGNPGGRDEEFWFEAEKQVLDETLRTVLAKVISPELQEAAADVQNELSHFVVKASNESAAQIKAAMERSTVIVPDGVRFYRSVNGDDYVIFEESPKVRTLLVNMAYNEPYIGAHEQDARVVHNHQQVRVALPYVVYGIRLRKGYIAGFQYWFRNAPIKSVEDSLHLSHLPNTDERGQPCVPWEGMHMGATLVDQIKKSIQTFWGTEFNYRLHRRLPDDQRVRSFDAWKACTEENPLFVLDVKWAAAVTSVKGMIPSQEVLQVPSQAAFQAESNKFVKAAHEILKLEIPKVKPVEPPKKVLSEGFATFTYS